MTRERPDIARLLRHLAVADLSYVEVRADERAVLARGGAPIPEAVAAQPPSRTRRLRWTVAVASAAPRAGATTVAALLRRVLARSRAVGPHVVDLSASAAHAPVRPADEVLVVARADGSVLARVGAIERQLAEVRRASPARWVLNAFDAADPAQRSAASALRGFLGARLAVLHRDDHVAAALRAGAADDDLAEQSQLWADAETIAAALLEATEGTEDQPWWR